MLTFYLVVFFFSLSSSVLFREKNHRIPIENLQPTNLYCTMLSRTHALVADYNNPFLNGVDIHLFSWQCLAFHRMQLAQMFLGHNIDSNHLSLFFGKFSCNLINKMYIHKYHLFRLTFRLFTHDAHNTHIYTQREHVRIFLLTHSIASKQAKHIWSPVFPFS